MKDNYCEKSLDNVSQDDLNSRIDSKKKSKEQNFDCSKLSVPFLNLSEDDVEFVPMKVNDPESKRILLEELKGWMDLE